MSVQTRWRGRFLHGGQIATRGCDHHAAVRLVSRQRSVRLPDLGVRQPPAGNLVDAIENMTFGLADTRRPRRFTVSKASAPTPPIALGPVRGCAGAARAIST